MSASNHVSKTGRFTLEPIFEHLCTNLGAAQGGESVRRRMRSRVQRVDVRQSGAQFAQLLADNGLDALCLARDIVQ